MKKTLFVTALAVVFVLAFSTAAFAVGPFFLSGTTGQNTNYAGYLSWNYIKGIDAANNAGTPHGGYTTTSNKCQVCHAVHRAKAGGSVLTAIADDQSYDNVLNTTSRNGALGTSGALTSKVIGVSGYTKGCAWCHNTGGFATYVSMASDGSIRPHTNCARCHIASPHGTGASEYPVLAARLLNTGADLAITKDLADSNNGLTADMFDLSAPAKAQTGLTLGTGYLCNGCHSGGSASTAGGLVFAVNTPGALPAQHVEGAATAGNTVVTGHRVTALATTTWNLADSPNTNTGTSFDPALPYKYNAFYTGQGYETGNLEGLVAAATGVSQIAWAPSNTCQTCHDQKLANGDNAFPHNYVAADGATFSTSSGQLGSGYIWMTTAANAADTHVVLAKDGSAANAQLSEDGLCLKCHVKDANDVPAEGNGAVPSTGGEGVGISF